jgi:hypothetical protein
VADEPDGPQHDLGTGFGRTVPFRTKEIGGGVVILDPGPGEPGYSQELRQDLAKAVEQNERSLEKTTVSEASTPRTWWEAISSHIVWGSLVFTCFLVFVEKLIEQHYGQALAALLLGLGVAAVALHSKAWLERTNPNWVFVGTAIAVMALVSFPFVEQQRWPFAWLLSIPSSSTVIHNQPSELLPVRLTPA